VYRGASNSVLLTPPEDNYFGEDGFGDFEFPNPPDPEELLQSKHAVVALIDTVNQYPGMYKQIRNCPIILNDTLIKRMYGCAVGSLITIQSARESEKLASIEISTSTRDQTFSTY
jgi:hypothetical protein